MPSSILGIGSLEPGALEHLLERCAYWRNPDRTPMDALCGRPVAALFNDLSTNTRPAFESAAQRIHATVSWAPSGESLGTLIEIASYMRPEVIVVSHPAPGTPALVARRVTTPVLNAGDGAHEHPVPALALTSELRSEGITRAAIVGDIRHIGFARSLVRLFSSAGIETSLCGPPPLCPPEVALVSVACTLFADLDQALEGVQAVIALPPPVPRAHELPFPESEYAAFFEVGPRHAIAGRRIYNTRLEGALPLRDPAREAAAWVAALEYALLPQ